MSERDEAPYSYQKRVPCIKSSFIVCSVQYNTIDSVASNNYELKKSKIKLTIRGIIPVYILGLISDCKLLAVGLVCEPLIASLFVDDLNYTVLKWAQKGEYLNSKTMMVAYTVMLLDLTSTERVESYIPKIVIKQFKVCFDSNSVN